MGIRPVSIPIPTGDGLSEETAYFFPLAKGNHDGIPMAYEFMESRGPEYLPNRQGLRDMTDSDILEYWETDAGVFWFRYRRAS